METSPSLVAVVDDDASVMTSVRRWLKMRDIPSLGCPDGDSLLTALVPGPQGWMVRPTPDSAGGRLAAAIIDLNLPFMNGFELAGRLLEVDPGLKVVIITAARWAEESHYDAPPPGVACLSKPFRLEDIEQLVLGPAHTGPGGPRPG